MAIKKEMYSAYNEKRKGKSVTDREGAADATINTGGGGIRFKEGDILSFEPVEGKSELDVRKNTEMNERGTYTCTCILIRKGQTVGTLIEAWPSYIGRMFPEYKMGGVGQFIPTGRTLGFEPPMGVEPNALAFWDRYLNKQLVCEEVLSGNTLNFQGDKIIPRDYMRWEVVDTKGKGKSKKG